MLFNIINCSLIRLCSEFQELEKTLLTVPASAKEMVALGDRFAELKAKEFQKLLEKVKVKINYYAIKRLPSIFLIIFFFFSNGILFIICLK